MLLLLERLNWAEINLKNYAHNIRLIKKIIGREVKLLAVIKGNAYGHGAVGIAKTCETLPVDYLGVVCLFEARQLREAGIKLPILILNYIDPEGACVALDLDVTVTVTDKKVLRSLNSYASKKKKLAKVHVKIDTGMHRAGLMPDEAEKFFLEVKKCQNIFVEGIFTHFASSDEKNLSFTRFQNKIFKEVLKNLEKIGINPPLIHAANSAAMLRLSKTHYNMVRPGVLTYGLPKVGVQFKPVLSWKTRIAQIRTIKVGESVGYGREFVAKRETRVGLLPVGYGDGFRRGPINFGFVLIKGKKTPVLGRVSMDQTSIDLTAIPDVKIGDEVVLIGKQGKEKITVEDIAARIGTISYEVTCGISSRVPRIIKKQ